MLLSFFPSVSSLQLLSITSVSASTAIPAFLSPLGNPVSYGLVLYITSHRELEKKIFNKLVGS